MSPRARARRAAPRRAVIGALVLGLPYGCAVGPSYEPTAAVPGATRVGAARPSAATRAFFDSLATARARDPALARVTTAALRTPVAGGLAGEDLRWLEILRDSVLTGLVETAVRQNRDLAGARARIREFRAEVGVARAPLFPSVTLSSSASRQQVAFAGFPPALFTALTVTGDLAWELDFWGGTRRELQAARADLASEGAAERGLVLELVSEVASGYLSLLALDQERRIAEETLASRQTTLELARQRLAQGAISELDVHQFEAQHAVPAAVLADVQELQALQENALSQLLGEAPMRIPRGGTLRDAARALTVPDSLPAELLARRPDVQQAEQAFAAATARIGAADAARLPAVSIVSSYGSQASEPDLVFDAQSRIWSARAGLSFRVYTGGELEDESRAARARAEQAGARYEQIALTALREAADALTGVRSSRDLVAAEQTRTGALRRALELAEVRYTSGVSSYLEVLEAQRGLFDAELALTRAELRQLIAAVQLYKALGGSWPAGRSTP